MGIREEGLGKDQLLSQHGSTVAPVALSSPGTTRRQHRLHGTPPRAQRLVRLAWALAACQQRLAPAHRRGSGLRARRNRQRQRLFRYLAPPRPWSWWTGERFWWGLRWFGAGMAAALLASR
ncbi:MAG: hypothetical protein OXF25_10320 [Cyanobacteria bacterium MAG CAR3_bin_5]|nr:hypothetical protein [Cyanobacteria bacterium MAG CAR4_bin_6]MCY4174428.1 hypothetical protein [Cyanobacteria bacterium MAG CAR3_bin_5]MCY4235362.1 hypothetical protein [Cyanobacteria bacterium MAG CAR2_bin_4]